MSSVETKPSSNWYSELRVKVDRNILHLTDGRGIFLLDKVDNRIKKYFYKNCMDKPWNNHLLFALFVQTDRNLDPQTIQGMLSTINSRMIQIFDVYMLRDMNAFDVDVHFFQYLKGNIFPEHSTRTRAVLLSNYKGASYATKKWLSQKLSSDRQKYFEKFLFSTPSFDSREFSYHRKAMEQAQNIRKDETDAILPYLPEIRTTARFRWSQTKRLREACI